MDAKFTPGDWRIEERNVPLADTGDYSGHTAIVSDDGTVIAEWWDREWDEFDANAKLIAAAPELYEALRDAQSALAMLVDPANYATSTMHAYAHVKLAESKARAALAKAAE